MVACIIVKTNRLLPGVSRHIPVFLGVLDLKF